MTATDTQPATLPTPQLATRKPFLSPPLFWTCFLFLTALAAFLRFWRLDYQAYWTDEAYTVYRIRGYFSFLLNQLTDQGFPPGWYAILRLFRVLLESRMDPGDTYLPQYLRLVPAFFGTLTVPAMYFLARQFTDRKGALLVMLLAAVNPFFIYYSRDIKMYSGFWFFVVLNMALFLQWQSSKRHLLWFPLFLLSGVFLTSMNSMAWFMIALQLIFILTRPKPRPWDAPLWAIASAAAAILPIYWFFEFVDPARWEGRLNGNVNQGLFWIQDYTDMSRNTLLGLPTSHILGYLWPENPPGARLQNWFELGGDDFMNHLNTRSWPWMAHWQLYAAVTVFAILVIGLIPWRGKRGRRSAEERALSSTSGRWWWIGLWILLPTLALALTWIPTDSPWFDRVWSWSFTATSDGPKPFWEPRYLGIIVPAWLLWLAASMRRLPLLPLRILAITFVTGVCTYSSLSNHLIYRNAPFNRAAAILEQYIDQKARVTTAVAVPDVKYPYPAESMATTVARKLAPLSAEDQQYVPYPQGGQANREPTFFPINLNSEPAVFAWLRNAVVPSTRIKTIVLTDRYGDLANNPSDILSDDSIKKLLGPKWTLVHTEMYEWHYEWRFYIFHTWRTRVWQLTSSLPAATSAATRN